MGRRLTRVTILTGSIVRVWGTLETVLERYQLGLSRSDRTMRVVRADFGAFGSIIGAPTFSGCWADLRQAHGNPAVMSASVACPGSPVRSDQQVQQFAMPWCNLGRPWLCVAVGTGL